MNRACENCAFYVYKTEANGLCRRYPPVSFTSTSYSNYNDEGSVDSYWDVPKVDRDFWCGEFKVGVVNMDGDY